MYAGTRRDPIEMEQTVRDELGLELPPSAIKIRDAARALTQEKAFAEVTIADVARRSGVNEVTIYRIFGSRDGLAAACWSTNLPVLRRGIRRDHAGLQDPVDRVKAHLRRLARIAASDREITQSLILAIEVAAMGSSSATGTLDPRELVPLPQMLTPLIVDAQDAGLMRNDYAAFDLAVFLTNGLLLRLLTRPTHTAATISRFAIDLSLEGVLTHRQ